MSARISLLTVVAVFVAVTSVAAEPPSSQNSRNLQREIAELKALLAKQEDATSSARAQAERAMQEALKQRLHAEQEREKAAQALKAQSEQLRAEQARSEEARAIALKAERQARAAAVSLQQAEYSRRLAEAARAASPTAAASKQKTGMEQRARRKVGKKELRAQLAEQAEQIEALKQQLQRVLYEVQMLRAHMSIKKPPQTPPGFSPEKR